MNLSLRKGRRLFGSRGATEVILVILVAGLVAAALFASGIAPTLLSTSDGLTWLGDNQRGEAVQVNPATGQQENRLKVAPVNHDISLAQRDGLLVVTDATNGSVTVINVSTLITGGRWFGNGGGAIEVLLNAKELYVVDRVRGTVVRLDPVSARPIGAGWMAGGLLADAAMDGKGKLWALRGDGQLHTLAWSQDTERLVETTSSVRVDGADLRSRLVSHDEGITLFAPERGVAVRVGTGDDTVVEVGKVPGTINAATEAPSDLVPVSVVESATVLLFHRGRAITVDVGKMGCQKPGEPVVYRGRVYVACAGARKVLVLGRDGEHRPPDIQIPAGEPKLVIDDGKLFIHVSGGNVGYVVNEDGKVTQTETHDATQPVNDPDNRPSPKVPTTKPPRSTPTNTTTTTGGGGGGETPSPSVEPPPTSAAPAGPRVPGAPTGVSISAQFEYGTTLRVEASWQSPPDNGSPLTGFELLLTSDRGFSQRYNLTALRSDPVEIGCGSRCHGMRVQAEVRAANGQGQGPAATGGYTHNAPAQSPATGEVVVNAVDMYEAAAPNWAVHAVFNPPFAWRTYEGSCTLNWSGPTTGSLVVLCWATSFEFTLSGGGGNYRFWMQAGGVRSNEVQVYAFREPIERPPCRGCEIP
ncbi:fibronectin type III domain-containing protein [Allorhizocola rhizosphaerae]|uniref:fibronectin type III domain-containing protein n=1 Tax=Allorhizocola rhizosphaerae TaxID=1872709 RepID=UPI000E3E225B|nr:fibronectin type III domain-containing protein [Allorhizocola rhizosphaerae]